MQFGILGPLEVLDADRRAVDLGPPKQRALLAALLVRANRVVSLDRLIDDLWGAAPPPAATGSLQAYVSNLRRLLEPDRAPRTPAEVLASRPPGYLLHVAAEDLDAARFENGLEEARRDLAGGRADAARRVLEGALRLWRGPVLADLAHWDFAGPEVARLEGLRLTAEELLVEAALMGGRHAEIVPYAEDLVRQEPLRERRRELLVLALYRCGRQADALDVLAGTRRLYATDLGIDPGPALQALQMAVLGQDPALDWQPSRDGPAAPAVPPPGGAARRASGLVGREPQLHLGHRMLDEARAGRPGVLLLTGEAGIGKTRLTEELAAHARRLGVAVGTGHSPDTDDVPAYWPWRQVVGELEPFFPETFDAAAAEAGPHLAPLTGAAAPEGHAPSRFLTAEAALTLLRTLATSRPLVVVLDDVHWSDLPSRELLRHLAGNLRRARVLVVATLRTTELPDPDLRSLLASLARERLVERAALPGLSPVEVAELVADRAGRAVPDALAAAVHEHTGGNPFFVSEVTRLLVSEHRLGGAASSEIGVPDSVRDVVQRRILRLPDQAVTLLSVAAVIGPEFDLTTLERVSGLSGDAIATALEAPVLTGLLGEVDDHPGRYRFLHALIRDAIYSGLPAPRRNALHARTAEALLAAARPDGGLALAHHAWRAGAALPAATVVPVLLAAATQAEATLAYEQAIDQFRRALTVLERRPAGPERDHVELDVVSRLARLLGETQGQSRPEVGDAYRRARQLALALDRPGPRAAATWGLSANRLLTGDYPEADGLAREMLELAHRIGSPEARLAGLHALGAVAFQRGEYDDADHHLRQAIAVAQERFALLIQADVPPTEAGLAVSSYAVHAMVRFRLGDPADRVAGIRDTALRLASQVHRPVVLAYASFVAAQLAVLQRDPAAVRRYAGEAIGLSRRHGFLLWRALGEIYDAWAAAVAGGEDGTARMDAAYAEVDGAGTRMLRTLVLGLRAEAALALGRPQEAREHLDAAMVELRATGERLYEPELIGLRDRLAGAPSLPGSCGPA